MVEPSLMKPSRLLDYRWWGDDVRIMWPKNGDPRYIIFGFRIYNFLNGGGVLVEPSLMQTCCFLD